MNTLGECSALIIDPNPTSRSVLGGQLRDFGLVSLTQCGRMTDARRLLETHAYDLVLCELDFHEPGHPPQSGAELLDELRASGRLPLTTVFVMVTGERSYAKVAEAAESALDCYLLKPFNAHTLVDRLLMARRRKRSLAEIHAAIAEDRFEEAAALCLARFETRGPEWLYAARLGAELLLRLERFAEARQLLDAVIGHQAVPWARLGIARAQLGQHQVAPALRTLESLVTEQPGYADAYDVLGRTHVSQGQLSKALDVYQKATGLTPGSLRRQQKLGMLAFYAGDEPQALAALDRAVLIGRQSKSFDDQVLVLLAVLHFRRKQGKGLTRCVADLTHALERAPGSRRIQRLLLVAQCLDLMRQRQVAQVLQRLRPLASQVREPDFDLEAASNLLTLLAELTAAELNLPDCDDWVRAVGDRFAGAKGTSEVLLSAAAAHPPHAELLRERHAKVIGAAESALMHSISGAPDRAFGALIANARRTLNQKFIETARGLLRRYRDTLDDLPALERDLDDVARLAGPKHNAMPLAHGDDATGGIRLRTAGAAAGAGAAGVAGAAGAAGTPAG